MSIVSEFKQFIQRGNVVDLAVGVIMGAAFGKIVTSLVSDLIMPPIGYVIGGVKFSDLKWELPKKSISMLGGGDVELPQASINYGNFLQTTFDFLIIAFCIFLLVKGINSLQKKKEAAPPEPTPSEKLLTEIRDLLKAKSAT